MDQRFVPRPMDEEGRTVSLVSWVTMIPTIGTSVADFEASEETLRQRLEKMAAVAEERAS